MSADCPLPQDDYPTVQLAHGGGGRLMRQLLDGLILPTLRPEGARGLHDAAYLEELPPGAQLAFTTDSYVVRPLFFPGGDIGGLAVHGTINDLAMAGARALALSVSLILEEGLSMATLRRVLGSLRQAADGAGVRVVTGDTKVVERGRADGLYINTAGIGVVPAGVCVHPDRIRPGDALLVSGDIARHGMAVLARREGLEFEAAIDSDCQPLWGSMPASTCTVCATRPAAVLPARWWNWRARHEQTCWWRRPPCRWRRRSLRPANCWGSIRCTWPAKADWWPSCRRRRPTARSTCCEPRRAGRRRR